MYIKVPDNPLTSDLSNLTYALDAVIEAASKAPKSLPLRSKYLAVVFISALAEESLVEEDEPEETDEEESDDTDITNDDDDSPDASGDGDDVDDDAYDLVDPELKLPIRRSPGYQPDRDLDIKLDDYYRQNLTFLRRVQALSIDSSRRFKAGRTPDFIYPELKNDLELLSLLPPDPEAHALHVRDVYAVYYRRNDVETAVERYSSHLAGYLAKTIAA